MKIRIVQFISNLFHPLFSMPWAAVMFVLFSPMRILPIGKQLSFVVEVLLFSFLFPALSIVLLSKSGIVKNGVALRERADRVVPLFLQFIFCTMQAILLGVQGFPTWTTFCFLGGSYLTFIFFIVTFWWKISGHAAGNSALAVTALLLYFWFPNIMPLCIPIISIIIAGLVSSIRVYLHRHTLAQVAVGALVGALCIFTSYLITC